MTDFVATGSERARSATRRLDRRTFLKAGVGGAAVLGSLGAVGRVAHAGDDTPGSGSLGSGDAVRTLVSRITNGFSLDDYKRAKALGYSAYLEEQLTPDAIEDAVVEDMFGGYRTLKMTPYYLRLYYQEGSANRNRIIAETEENTVCRRAMSKRQLYERMVEFWTDHFNIDRTDGVTRYFVPDWDRRVIRKYTMGKFPDLLKATAHHAGMLNYLDNNTNRVGRPQENYARELLELHTLGVDNGYTQQDVVEVARCLTGWTFHGPARGYGVFRFISSRHDRGAKKVLGHSIPANQAGTADGDFVLDILWRHPNTAAFIAKKLAIHFLRYDPPAWLVQDVARTYLNTGGDIRSMLRTLLQERNITLATPKLKRPTHLLCALLRATESEVNVSGDPTNPIGRVTAAVGHQPYVWPTPDGYPDYEGAWGQALQPRWTMASTLIDGRYPWVSVDPIRTLAKVPGGLTPGRQASAIDRILTGGALPEEDVLKLQMFIDQNLGTTQTLRDALGIAASLPGFQYY